MLDAILSKDRRIVNYGETKKIGVFCKVVSFVVAQFIAPQTFTGKILLWCFFALSKRVD